MGAIYALFSAFYYWIGKITGYQYNNILSLIHFWVFTIAINIVFFPMHALGMSGKFEIISNYVRLLVPRFSYIRLIFIAPPGDRVEIG